MERKIGEIFEYNGEWYQCVEFPFSESEYYCDGCSISASECVDFICDPGAREDNKRVIFKKLEKVGEPYFFVDKIVQNYLLETEMSASPEDVFILTNNELRLIAIEIKQNKEDMEEKNNAKHSNSEKIGKNLKPFNLEAAKAGKPVCTRDGRKARIICFDLQSIENTSIVAAVQVTDKQEVIANYYENGRQFINGISELDLMMLPEKKEGWVNIYYEHDAPSHREARWVYDKEEEAIKVGKEHGSCYIATVRIEWGE